MSRPDTSASTKTTHTHVSNAPAVGVIDLDAFARKKVVYSGPDGLRVHRYPHQEGRYVGEGEQSHERTSSSDYLFRSAPDIPFPRGKKGRIGETGWQFEQWQVASGI